MKNCNILGAMKKAKLINGKRDKCLMRSHFIAFKKVTPQ